MEQVLVTGASGNIGKEVIHYLAKLGMESSTVLAVRNIEKGKKHFLNFPSLTFRHFDFENQNSFGQAFESIDTLFLLRPPHISKVEEYFTPLLKSAKACGIQQIVFLSVQGAEKSKVIPHNKIEELIKAFGFDYIFIRPSYFMQNLTTTLLPEIQKTRTITLPAGRAKFNWIDVKNIGEASAKLIKSFKNYQNAAYEVTGTENRSFQEVTDIMTRVTGTDFYYRSMNPLSFYFKKKKEGAQRGFAIVMTMLHFLPRIQKEPEISDIFYKLTSKQPTTLENFIEREKEKLLTRK